MFDRIVDKAKQSVARALRTTVIGAGAGLCLVAGAALLTLAGWLFLVTVTTPMNAALILGGIYLGLGFILIGVASAARSSDSQGKAAQQQQDADENVVPKLIAAFMTGMQAGRSTRS